MYFTVSMLRPYLVRFVSFICYFKIRFFVNLFLANLIKVHRSRNSTASAAAQLYIWLRQSLAGGEESTLINTAYQ